MRKPLIAFLFEKYGLNETVRLKDGRTISLPPIARGPADPALQPLLDIIAQGQGSALDDAPPDLSRLDVITGEGNTDGL